MSQPPRLPQDDPGTTVPWGSLLTAVLLVPVGLLAYQQVTAASVDTGVVMPPEPDSEQKASSSTPRRGTDDPRRPAPRKADVTLMEETSDAPEPWEGLNETRQRTGQELSADQALAPRRETEQHQGRLSQQEVSDYLSRVEVELYVTSWCKYCRRARDFFAQNGVTVREYDVQQDRSAARRRAALAPGTGVPVARIDGQVVSGFQPTAYASALERALQNRAGVPVRVETSEHPSRRSLR